MKDRSVHQRNEALFHIETHRLDGIVYFADGENIYSIDLFVHLRQIRYLLLFMNCCISLHNIFYGLC